MRVLGLTVFIALALFSFAVGRNSDRQEVALAYREQLELHAIFRPDWRALQDARIVDIDVDGDHADVSLRIGGCTLPTFDAHLDRDEAGRWKVNDGIEFDQRAGPCKEGGQIPPPELAWTWQDRNWR